MLNNMVTASYSELVEIGTRIGIQIANEEVNRKKYEIIKHRRDKRLRNTKLLLENYLNFQEHIKSSIFDKRTVKENAIDILDELDQFQTSETAYIESIKQSCSRTAIIVEHVDKMIDIYQILMKNSKLPEDERKYIILHKMYFQKNKLSVKDIAIQVNITESQVYRNIKDSIDFLSSLIFGIDGIKVRI